MFFWPSDKPNAVPLQERRGVALLLCAGALIALAVVAPHRTVTLGLGTAAVILLVLVCTGALRNRRISRRTAAAYDTISRFIAQDATPSFVTSSDGRILSRNAAARAELPETQSETLAGALKSRIANPGGLLFRLQSRAGVSGRAQEDIVTAAGQIRLSVQGMGSNGFVWRLERLPGGGAEPVGQENSFGLPMITVGRSGAVLFMNPAARRLIGTRVKSLDRLFDELPITPGTVSRITTAAGAEHVIPAELDGGAGRRAICLLPTAEVPSAQGNWPSLAELPVPLLRVAPDGVVEYHNRMAAQLLGDALVDGVHLSQLMEGLGRSITDWLEDTIAGRITKKSEFLRLTRADKEVFVQVFLNRVMEGGAPRLIAVLNDATELKSLEAQFVQSQKMQAIGQLAGGVAHDFNNLLTAISGHCDLLLLRHDQGDSDYGDLVQISQNANRAAALVGQLLAFSRKQTLRPETLDLRDTLADLTHLLNRLVGETVTLSLSHDPVLEPIRADKRQMEQVLMNLVVNARDSMPAGGEIRIVTERKELTEPMQRDRVTLAPGKYVLLKVSDSGCGIPPDKREKVFEPFFTTKKTGEGTGLGLSTAYGIIKQTGGFIFVDSTVDLGTTFSIYFPVLDRVDSVAPKPKPIAQAAPDTHQADGVVLLVEDEAPVRAFASRALRLRGYTVLEADSAETALEMLEDASLKIDVFVTDVVMPGIDGPSWVREALKARPGTRVVFVSGYAEESFGESQRSIPNSVFLPKPFSLSDLTETVRSQLH